MEIRVEGKEISILDEGRHVTISQESPDYDEIMNAYNVINSASYSPLDSNYIATLRIYGPDFVVKPAAELLKVKSFDSPESGFHGMGCIYSNVIKYHMVTYYIHEILNKLYSKDLDTQLRKLCIELDSQCYRVEQFSRPCYFRPVYAARYSGVENHCTNDNYVVVAEICISKTKLPITIDYSNEAERRLPEIKKYLHGK